MKQKKNGFFITILLLLISLAFIVTVSVVFNNIKTNLEREIISSLSEEAEENETVAPAGAEDSEAASENGTRHAGDRVE